jgi:glutathione S-transferase
MSDMILWGFDGSTYVRTVKMVLAEKGATEFKQVPLNVLAGDPKTPEHRERHPFGKVPVLDHDGMRILETAAIARYLNDVLPGKSLIPSTPKGSRADGYGDRPHRLLRLQRPDWRRGRLSPVSGFRRG